MLAFRGIRTATRGLIVSPDIKFCRLMPTLVLPSHSDNTFAADARPEKQSLL